MTNTQKAIKTTAIVICAALLAAIIIWGMCWGITSGKSYFKHKGWTPINYCAERWDISLPDNAKIEYSISTQRGFHNEGEIYTVCRVEKLSDSFKDTLTADTDGKYLASFYTILEKTIASAKSLSKEINVDTLNVPSDKCIWYKKVKDNDTLLLAFDSAKNMLYIIEDIM